MEHTNILKFPTPCERWMKEAEKEWERDMKILESLSEEEMESLFLSVEEK